MHEVVNPGNMQRSQARPKRIHFVGIGGSGMSGIAEILFREGYIVSGSDQQSNATTNRLSSLGIKIYVGHAAENIDSADVLVYSTAVPQTNPELQAAKKAQIPLLPRAQMLAELMRFRYGIAIAGTHGKTTTTSLIATVFAAAQKDPTFVIGGKLNSAGSNAHLGSGQYLIVEADESDASFLYLDPIVVVVTNIDKDHMSTYHNDFHELEATFLKFVQQVPFDGCVIACLDDPVIEKLLPQMSRPTLTYGEHANAHFRLKNYRCEGLRSFFECWEGERCYPITLNIPGRHNALNALATIAVALHEGISIEVIQKALAQFSGVGRRFQSYALNLPQVGAITLVDDYGHHPTELSATLMAAREAFVGKRIIMVFQPHRYTRTRDLFEDFVSVLSRCDQVILLDVYDAGEAPIPGANSRDLIRSIRMRSDFEPLFAENLAAVSPLLTKIAQEGDIVIFQGAGNIGALVQEWVTQYEEPHDNECQS